MDLELENLRRKEIEKMNPGEVSFEDKYKRFNNQEAESVVEKRIREKREMIERQNEKAKKLQKLVEEGKLFIKPGDLK
jgi:hypothetical protein